MEFNWRKYIQDIQDIWRKLKKIYDLRFMGWDLKKKEQRVIYYLKS